MYEKYINLAWFIGGVCVIFLVILIVCFIVRILVEMFAWMSDDDVGSLEETSQIEENENE